MNYSNTIKTPRLQDKLGIWYGRTDFVPPGVKKPPVTPGNHYDPPASRALTVYVVVQFASLVMVGLSLTYETDQLSSFGLGLLFSYLLASLVILGWLLDHKTQRLEWARLFASLPLLVLFPLPSSLMPWTW